MPGDRVLWQRLAPLRVAWVILPSQVVPDPGVLEAHGLFRYVTTVGPRWTAPRHPSALEAHGLFHYVTTVGPMEVFRVTPSGSATSSYG